MVRRGVAVMGRKSTERLGAKGKRCALDEPLFHHVHAHQLDAARAFRKRARDIFVVNHHVAENLSPQQLGMQIGLSETRRCAGTDLRVPLGKQLATQLELPGIRGVGAEPGIKVFGVVGIKLALNDDFRGCVLWHRLPLQWVADQDGAGCMARDAQGCLRLFIALIV